MKTITKFEEEMPSNYKLFIGGDNHIGNIDSDIPLQRKTVRKIRSGKHSYYISVGDQLECIEVTDKRFKLEQHGGWKSRLNEQRDFFIELYEPIADKVLWIQDGNHEYRWSNNYTPNADIAKALGAVYAQGVLTKAFMPGFRMITWHPKKGAIESSARDGLQQQANEALSLKRRLVRLPGADCALMAAGHFHKLIIAPPQRKLQLVSRENGVLKNIYTKPGRVAIQNGSLYRIPEDDRWYACTGSFLKGYVEGHSTYVEEVGYSPQELGCICVIVQNDAIKDIKKVDDL